MIGNCLLIVAVASVVTATTFEAKPEYCINYHPGCPQSENANSTATHLEYYQDCHKFYKCDHGRACVFACPTYNDGVGQLVFNPQLQVCDYPGNVPGLPNCSGSSTNPQPTNSQPTNPQPTNPQPTNPQPTNPQPTNPQPTNPQPTNPQPTNPQPTNPQPTNPQPTNPQPTNPQPTNPQPTNPQPTNPRPTNPRPTNPQPTNPQPTNSTPNTTPGGSIPADCHEKCPDIGRARLKHEKCNFYYDCVDGKHVTRQCLENLYFNCYIQACDLFHNLPAHYNCTKSDSIE